MASRSKRKQLRRQLIDKAICLTKEQWQTIANELLDAGPFIQDALREAKVQNPEYSKVVEDHPGLDPDGFETDIRMAVAAITYVANFAIDKCKITFAEEDEINEL